jgi:hypothetical protein
MHDDADLIRAEEKIGKLEARILRQFLVLSRLRQRGVHSPEGERLLQLLVWALANTRRRWACLQAEREGRIWFGSWEVSRRSEEDERRVEAWCKSLNLQGIRLGGASPERQIVSAGGETLALLLRLDDDRWYLETGTGPFTERHDIFADLQDAVIWVASRLRRWTMERVGRPPRLYAPSEA